MFYAHFVLNKRGPWTRIWLAAHWDKKLTKAQVFETDVESTVNSIISPEVKLALRTSGHLLLGVVRIYNRKSKYLLADCNEAFIKIKMAFRPGVVDLPEENREAEHNQIYLMDEFSDFNAPLPDISDMSMGRNLTLNQSRIEEITMPEEVHTSFPIDDAFGGDMLGFEKDDQFSAGDLQSMFYKDDRKDGKDMGFGMKSFADEGGLLGGGFMDGPGLFGEGEGFLGDGQNQDKTEDQPMETEAPTSPQQKEVEQQQQQLEQQTEPQQLDTTLTQPEASIIQPTTESLPPIDDTVNIPVAESTGVSDQTTLVANEEEAFVLAPLDVTVGVKDVRMRRKRKLVIDQNMELDGQTMREQMKDFSDIVVSMDMAPPTKKLMQWKEISRTDKLLSITVNTMLDDHIKVFQSQLTAEIPDEFANLTSSQLDEIYGRVDEQSVADESSIQIARDQSTINPNNISEMPTPLATPMQPPNQTDGSIQIPRDANNAIMAPTPITGGYQSDDDYAEPFSVGPPSIAPLPPKSPEPIPVNPPSFATPMGDLPDLSLNNMVEPEMPTLNTSDLTALDFDEEEQYPDNVDELRWNKRTQQMLRDLQRNFNHSPESLFFDITENATKKTAASKFYALLVLAKQEAVQLAQEEKFSVIYIKKGQRFDNLIM